MTSEPAASGAADVTTTTSIAFIVWGRPQQRGSKQASLIPKRGGGYVQKNGRPVVVARDMNQHSKEWMSQVRDAALAAYNGELIQGPVRLVVHFKFKRPQSHYRSNGTLRDSAPHWHSGTPDCDKLQRCLGDALTGVLLQDDKQIASWNATKSYTIGAECAEVTLENL